MIAACPVQYNQDQVLKHVVRREHAKGTKNTPMAVDMPTSLADENTFAHSCKCSATTP